MNFIVELAKMFSEKQPSKFSLDPVLDLGPTVPFQGPLIRKQASVGRPKMSRPRSVLVPSRPEDELGRGRSQDDSFCPTLPWFESSFLESKILEAKSLNVSLIYKNKKSFWLLTSLNLRFWLRQKFSFINHFNEMVSIIWFWLNLRRLSIY